MNNKRLITIYSEYLASSDLDGKEIRDIIKELQLIEENIKRNLSYDIIVMNYNYEANYFDVLAQRYETDEECKERVKTRKKFQKEIKAQKLEKDRQEYERLRKKFGDK